METESTAYASENLNRVQPQDERSENAKYNSNLSPT